MKRRKKETSLNVALMREFVARQAALINDPALRLATLKTLDDPRYQ